MNIEKLIERLKHEYHGYSTVENDPETAFHDLVECLTALSTIPKLRAELEQTRVEIARLKKYEDKCHDCPIVCAKTEVIKAHEELEQVKRALAMMWFAYINKSEEFPHSFELEALEKAEHILGPWEKCMLKYLKRGQEEG